MDMNKDKQRLIIFGAIILALILVVIIVVVAIIGGNNAGENDKNSTDTSEVYIPSGKQYIEDIYEGKYLIPKYDIAESKLDLDQFKTTAGIISYPEAKMGIDVSDHQKYIDWALVKSASVDYAIMRAGYRGYTEGGLFQDEYFEQNMQGAIDNGIDVGVYFFSQAISTDEAEQEAQYVIDLIQKNNYEITYPIYYDWEPITTHGEGAAPRTENCTGDDISSFTKAFCEKIKSAGYIPGYYTNKTMGYSSFDLKILEDYDLWYAEYQPKPSFFYEFEMWQYTDGGTIPGIETNVDVNLSFKNYE